MIEDVPDIATLTAHIGNSLAGRITTLACAVDRRIVLA